MTWLWIIWLCFKSLLTIAFELVVFLPRYYLVECRDRRSAIWGVRAEAEVSYAFNSWGNDVIRGIEALRCLKKGSPPAVYQYLSAAPSESGSIRPYSSSTTSPTRRSANESMGWHVAGTARPGDEETSGVGSECWHSRCLDGVFTTGVPYVHGSLLQHHTHHHHPHHPAGSSPGGRDRPRMWSWPRRLWRWLGGVQPEQMCYVTGDAASRGWHLPVRRAGTRSDGSLALGGGGGSVKGFIPPVYAVHAKGQNLLLLVDPLLRVVSTLLGYHPTAHPPQATATAPPHDEAGDGDVEPTTGCPACAPTGRTVTVLATEDGHHGAGAAPRLRHAVYEACDPRHHRHEQQCMADLSQQPPSGPPDGASSLPAAAAKPESPQRRRRVAVKWMQGRAPSRTLRTSAGVGDGLSPIVVLLVCPSVMQGGLDGHVVRRLGVLCEQLSVIADLREARDAAQWRAALRVERGRGHLHPSNSNSSSCSHARWYVAVPIVCSGSLRSKPPRHAAPSESGGEPRSEKIVRRSRQDPAQWRRASVPTHMDDICAVVDFVARRYGTVRVSLEGGAHGHETHPAPPCGPRPRECDASMLSSRGSTQQPDDLESRLADSNGRPAGHPRPGAAATDTAPEEVVAGDAVPGSDHDANEGDGSVRSSTTTTTTHHHHQISSPVSHDGGWASIPLVEATTRRRPVLLVGVGFSDAANPLLQYVEIFGPQSKLCALLCISNGIVAAPPMGVLGHVYDAGHTAALARSLALGTRGAGAEASRLVVLAARLQLMAERMGQRHRERVWRRAERHKRGGAAAGAAGWHLRRPLEAGPQGDGWPRTAAAAEGAVASGAYLLPAVLSDPTATTTTTAMGVVGDSAAAATLDRALSPVPSMLSVPSLPRTIASHHTRSRSLSRSGSSLASLNQSGNRGSLWSPTAVRTSGEETIRASSPSSDDAPGEPGTDGALSDLFLTSPIASIGLSHPLHAWTPSQLPPPPETLVNSLTGLATFTTATSSSRLPRPAGWMGQSGVHGSSSHTDSLALGDLPLKRFNTTDSVCDWDALLRHSTEDISIASAAAAAATAGMNSQVVVAEALRHNRQRRMSSSLEIVPRRGEEVGAAVAHSLSASSLGFTPGSRDGTMRRDESVDSEGGRRWVSREGSLLYDMARGGVALPAAVPRLHLDASIGLDASASAGEDPLHSPAPRSSVPAHAVRRALDPKTLAAQELFAGGSVTSARQQIAMSMVELRYKSLWDAALLSRICTPTMFIHARDDDMTPFATFPLKTVVENPKVFVVVTRRGGHGVFLESAVTAWSLPRLVAVECHWPCHPAHGARHGAAWSVPGTPLHRHRPGTGPHPSTPCASGGTSGGSHPSTAALAHTADHRGGGGEPLPAVAAEDPRVETRLCIQGASWMERLILEFVISAVLDNGDTVGAAQGG